MLMIVLTMLLMMMMIDAHVFREKAPQYPTVLQKLTIWVCHLSFSLLWELLPLHHHHHHCYYHYYSLACIMYTSGSTGVPKGVETTHANIMGMVTAISKLYDINESDIFLHYLPLAHSMAFSAETVLLYKGLPLGYGVCLPSFLPS